MNEKTAVRSLVDQLKPFIHDANLAGRVFADLVDMLEACKWFVSKIEGEAPDRLTRDELETLLIEVDVNMLQHLSHHLESLKKNMPAVLDAVGLPDDSSTG